MSGWFSIDPNKLKELAANTLINAQKHIDKVLDIKDLASGAEPQPTSKNNLATNIGINNPPPPSTITTTTDEFFSTFLNNQKSSTSNIEKEEIKIEKDSSFSNWNSWTDQNNTSQMISSESQSDLITTEQTTNEEERTPIIESIDIPTSSLITESIDIEQVPTSSLIIESVGIEQVPTSSLIIESVGIEQVPTSSLTTESVSIEQVPSSSSLTESSTITESSSSESANSLRPILNIPSSESTIIGQIIENIIDEKQIFINNENENIESNNEQQSETIQSLPSDKRDVIDSWINNRENNTTENNLEQSLQNKDDTNALSLLYTSSYPPNNFSTSSIIDDDLTPTSVSTTNHDKEQQLETISTDEEDVNPYVEQSNSPTHTASSSNGNDTHSKGSSSDDGKHTSCTSSDIEVISCPSVTGGLPLSTTDTFDKCRELRDARRAVVREVVVRFPSHSTNLKYHHHPLSMDNIDKNITSNFDTPSWSTLIDEAATEQNHYQDSHEENDDNQEKFFMSETSKELGELKERLELREQAFKKLTNESNELHRTNQSLKQSLTELEQRTSRLTIEFQQTIENLSMKIEEQKHVSQERDHLRKQLDTLQKQLFENSTSSGNTLTVLREKEEQIQQLLDEGEKLSKTQLQHTNIIKKLRTKEKEHETQITSLNARSDKLTNELDEAKKNLQEKEENEKQLKETVKKLEKSAIHYEKECISLKSLYEDAEEQIRSTKVALENSYKEIAELNKTKAATESKVVEATLSAEILLKEEIRLAVEKERIISRQEQEKLQMTIDELRHSIQRSEIQLNRREQVLRQEINDLRQRLQEAESRNEDLTQNISNATRPLLRQIENLQTTYVTQINSLEKTERQLTDRLAEMQAQYAMSVEHERVANETLLETNAKWKLAEAQLSTLKQDKTRFTAEIDILRMKLTNLEDSRQREKNQIETMQEAFTQQINSLIQEKRQFELDAELEKTKYESDLKRLQIVHDALKEQNNLFDAQSISRSSSNLESTLQQQRSRRSSGGHDTPSSFSFERSPFVPTPKPSVYETLRNTGAIAVLESLESQLKEKEGEITLLQSEIADLERTRESMARELVNLSTINEKLQQQTQNYPILNEQYKELEKRYDALLTMYGEKQEEADELRLDLADVKTLYRAQMLSLSDSYSCRLSICSSLEKLFSSNPTIPYPSHVYIYGNNNTGKSTIIKYILNKYNHTILWFDCREIYSLNMFYHTFISLLSNNIIPVMKNFNDFIRILRDLSIQDMNNNNNKKKKTKQYYFVVLHHIELLLNYDTTGHLLYLLFKLNELTLGYFHHTLILIGHQPFYQLPQMNQIEAELGVLTPITIFVPAYTRTEIVTILQNILTQQQDILPSSISQLQIIIELALQSFYIVTNDLIELKDMITMCIKDFLRSNTKKQINDDGTNHDYRILYQKEFFMQVLNSVYTRSMSIPRFLDTHTADEETTDKSSHISTINNKNNTRDLPLSAKFLLIAIYLATQNPIKYDRMLYDKQNQGKKSRRAKIMHKRTQLESSKIEYLPLSSNKSISLNRLLAIYCSLQGDTIPLTTQIYTQLSLLTSMRLIELVGSSNETGIINLNEPKYRCTSSNDYVRRVAASIDFKIDNLILV
ncbi:unnamed protein product [Rotaria sordida]|uniref:Uncharacterized protein n=1 Tax=Rotaria sordida TaxID=392033 RepID=A0A818YMJ5_9BILA|nr:unnamed protein product [Rotaria sordida]